MEYKETAQWAFYIIFFISIAPLLLPKFRKQALNPAFEFIINDTNNLILRFITILLGLIIYIMISLVVSTILAAIYPVVVLILLLYIFQMIKEKVF